MSDAKRRVLGLDPGLGATGFGVIDGDGVHASWVADGAIRTKASRPRAERLHRIYEAVRELIEQYQPHEVAVEQQFVALNVRSAMAIGEARAAAMVAASSYGRPVFEFTPAAIKESVAGHGGAPKEQVRDMVVMHLNLSEPPTPLDASDALAIALTRLAELRLEAALARR